MAAHLTAAPGTPERFAQLERRHAVIDRALDAPWSCDDRDEDLWRELLDIEIELGRIEQWPHGWVAPVV